MIDFKAILKRTLYRVISGELKRDSFYIDRDNTLVSTVTVVGHTITIQYFPDNTHVVSMIIGDYVHQYSVYGF